MKKLFLLALLMSIFSIAGQAQAKNDSIKTAKIYVIIKNDGTEFIGQILSQDAREVLIKTEKIGDVIIPKHEVKEIRELKPGDVNQNGEYIAGEIFATRYFLTTNALSIKKGDSYIQWNLFGPDIQFGIADNFTVGAMTTWVAIPIIGSAKYTFELSENLNFGVGTLLGTGSWINPGFGFALPFGALTFGNEKTNINLMGGYASVFGDQVGGGGTPLFSIGAMVKASKKVSFVFDSFIVPKGNNFDGFAILIPGVRVQTGKDKAFQFGLGGAVSNGQAVPIPFPMMQWYRKI